MKYCEHGMDIVLFNDADIFTITLNSDADSEGGGSGKYSWDPAISDK